MNFFEYIWYCLKCALSVFSAGNGGGLPKNFTLIDGLTGWITIILLIGLLFVLLLATGVIKFETKTEKALKQFAEGKITTAEFWNMYQVNPKLKKFLLKAEEKRTRGKFYYSAGVIETHFNINDAFERFGLYEYVKSYFVRNKIDCNFYHEDEEYIALINKIQPKYVDIRSQEFWDKLISTIPEETKKAEKIKTLKARTKELFAYETKPPKWIQSPDWPIENNLPLKFIKQIKINDGYEYHFINEPSQQSVTVTQYY